MNERHLHPLWLKRIWIALAASVAVGGSYLGWSWWRGPELLHRHIPGAHGGTTIISVGHDHKHIEALLAEGGVIKLFMLGSDFNEVSTVPLQKVTAYVRAPETTLSVSIVLEAKPDPQDPPGTTSMFEGQLPLELVGSELAVVVPSLNTGMNRYRFAFLTRDDHAAQMPRKVTSEAERDLYLTPGGKLTAADIQANGDQTASQKYRTFRSEHDMHPAAGDVICPITHTKANPKCTWIVGGRKYRFCCPPCIDEFVKLAKESPDQVLTPGDYTQK